jgi:hypothetical protein
MQGFNRLGLATSWFSAQRRTYFEFEHHECHIICSILYISSLSSSLLHSFGFIMGFPVCGQGSRTLALQCESVGTFDA